jgi:hypothetical protein
VAEKKASHDETAQLRQLRLDMKRAVDSCDPEKFKRVLVELEIVPGSTIWRKRMAGFYRACNMDEP